MLFSESPVSSAHHTTRLTCTFTPMGRSDVQHVCNKYNNYVSWIMKPCAYHISWCVANLLCTYIKWLDVHITSMTSSSATIKLLHKSFSIFSLQSHLTNTTGFISEEFETFMKTNRVKHICTPPYHPWSNSCLACCKTLKGGLKKLKNGSLETKLSWFLFPIVIIVPCLMTALICH